VPPVSPTASTVSIVPEATLTRHRQPSTHTGRVRTGTSRDSGTPVNHSLVSRSAAAKLKRECVWSTLSAVLRGRRQPPPLRSTRASPLPPPVVGSSTSSPVHAPHCRRQRGCSSSRRQAGAQKTHQCMIKGVGVTTVAGVRLAGAVRSSLEARRLSLAALRLHRTKAASERAASYWYH
jgi:hypothetical protein